jgi:hypothetical protein
MIMTERAQLTLLTSKLITKTVVDKMEYLFQNILKRINISHLTKTDKAATRMIRMMLT